MAQIARIPIIKLYDNLIVSVQVALSDKVVQQLKEDITRKIEQTRARGLVIDLSGIGLMDSYISRTIRDIGLIGKLMGVHTVISGLDPMIAMTLVEMGMELKGVQTVLNLESALELLAQTAGEADAGDESEDAALEEALGLAGDGGGGK